MHSNTHIGVPSIEAGKSWSWLMCQKYCNIPVLENIQKLMEGKSKSGVGVWTGKALLRQETVPQETDWAQVDDRVKTNGWFIGTKEAVLRRAGSQFREMQAERSWGRWTEN